MQPPPPTKSGTAGGGYKNGGWGQPQHFGSLPELPRSFAKKPARHTAQAKKNSLPHYQPEQGEHSSQLGRTKGDMILEARHNWRGPYVTHSLTIVLQHGLDLDLDLDLGLIEKNIS